MGIEAPSNKQFKTLGKILFYGLILPALFYYAWQGLKTLFALLHTESKLPNPSHSEEDMPTSTDDQKILLRIKTVSNTKVKYDKSESVADLMKHNAGKIKQIVSTKMKIKPNEIKTLTFFRKKTTPALSFPADDPIPPQDGQYLKINAPRHVYYFTVIEGKSNPNEQKIIGKNDTILEAKQKISQYVKGNIDTNVRLLTAGKYLEDECSVKNYFSQESDQNATYTAFMQNAFISEGAHKQDKKNQEEKVLKMTF